jgi:hypothetical protein
MLNRDKNVWMFILHGVFDEYYIVAKELVVKISLHIDPRSIIYAARFLLLPVKNDGKTTDMMMLQFGLC